MPSEDEEIEELEAAIDADAEAGIQSASGDGQSVTMQNLKDRLEYLKHKKSVRASNVGLGIRQVKLIPPGTV